MTVAEYKAAFTQLEQFAQVFDTEKHRAKRFVEGLTPTLRSRVLGYQCLSGRVRPCMRLATPAT